MPERFERRDVLKGAASAFGAAAVPAPGWAQHLPDASESMGLDQLAQTRGLRFGSAFRVKDVLADRKLRALHLRESGIAVPSLAFKWKQLEKKRGSYRFEDADRGVRFARQNQMQVRGHTLCWNNDKNLPDWFLTLEPEAGDQPATRVANLLIEHIDIMLTRYPDLDSWDVVNEVIKVDTGRARDSMLVRTMGTDFVDLCFEYTRERLPQTELVYNDFMRWDRRPAHRNGVLKLLEDKLKRGVPIDALGIQSHIGPAVGDVDEKDWIRFLDEVKGMGLKVLLTELDCTDLKIASSDIAVRDKIAAENMKRYLDVTLSYDNVTEVITWGLCDKNAYVNKPHNLAKRRRADGLKQRVFAYDEDYRAKPMRDAIAQAIAQAPVR